MNKKGKPVIEFQNPATSAGGDIPDDAAASTSARRRPRRYGEIIRKAKTILWNGPMGMFEDKRFAAGTNCRGQSRGGSHAKNGAKSIIGGGDSVKALNKAGLGDKVTFMSTGGGASLEFLEGQVLPAWRR